MARTPHGRGSAWRLVASMGLALSLASVSFAAGIGVLAPTGLELRTGFVDTSMGGGPTSLVARVRASGPNVPVIVQLDGPMTPSRRERLEASGLTIGDYLPTNAFMVWTTAPAGARNAAGIAVDLAAMGQLEFVRWAGQWERAWKIDPELGGRRYQTAERQALTLEAREIVLVYTFAPADVNPVEAAIQNIPGAQLRASNQVGGRWELEVELGLAQVNAVADLAGVQWIEPLPENTPRSNYNTRWIVTSNVANNMPVHSRGITGVGQVVGVIDDPVATAHCSFSDPVNPIGPTHRKVVAYSGPLSSGFHGSHVAGTAVGDPGSGTPDPTDLRGVAFGAKLAYGGSIGSASSEQGFLTAAGFQQNAGARVHTNSWGNDSTTTYTATCRGIDRFTYDNEDNLVLFAVSNGSLVTTPENANNAFGIGATGPSGSQELFGSGGTGPTGQGLRRPEIWAPGQNTNSVSSSTTCGLTTATGTSMASPAVAGVAALVRQYFVNGWYPAGVSGGPSVVPSGALMRGVIINAGQDMTGSAGYPGVRENWGRVRIDDSLFFSGDARKLFVKDVRNAQGLATGASDETIVPVLGSTQQLRITMVFTAPAAAVNAANITINNLDLEVVSPTGQVFLGNVFNTATGQSQTGGAADGLNTAENVFVSSPTPGNWTVRVKGTAVNQGTQGFALVVTGDVAGGVLPPLIVSQVTPTPALVAPGVPTVVTARAISGSETLNPSSVALLYRTSITGPFTTVPMTSIGSDQFQASLPAFACGTTPQWYYRASSTAGTAITAPGTAPAAVFSTAVGTTNTTNTNVFAIDFGSTLPPGWSASGLWNFGSACPPSGTPCGTVPGAAYYGQPATCTYNTGTISTGTLTSPPIALPALPLGGSITMSLCSARVTESVSTFDLCDILVNGTVVGTANQSVAWATQTINLTAFAGQNVTIGFRFNTVDIVNNDFRGWHLDTIAINATVTTTECNQPGCYADCDQSAALSPADFTCFLGKYRAGDSYADCDQSTGLSPADFTCFLSKYRVGCP